MEDDSLAEMEKFYQNFFKRTECESERGYMTVRF